jgi:hypothetical protein
MQLTENESLRGRLEAIGAYTIAKRTVMEWLFGLPTVVEWQSSAALQNDLCPLSLKFCLDAKPRDFTPVLERLLAAWDAFHGRFLEYVPQFKVYLVELFRGCYLSELAPTEKAHYLGPDLQVSDEAILRHVHEGTVGLAWERGKVTQQVWFRVDWDHEHGADVEFDADGNLTKPWEDQGEDEEEES